MYVTTDEASPRLDSIDGGAFSAGRPWLPVRLRPTVIHCGPIIWPGSTPCFRCSVNRMKQHSPMPSLVGSGPELVEGYAAFHVRLIAAAISLLEERFSEGEILGRAYHLILSTGFLTTILSCPLIAVRDAVAVSVNGKMSTKSWAASHGRCVKYEGYNQW